MIQANDIKNALNLRQVCENYGVTFNRAGKALCPFHREKTPSFKVDKDRYYCFGCNAGGDVISFVMQMFGLDFKESLKKLNDDFSLNLDKNNNTDHGTIKENQRIQFKIQKANKAWNQEQKENYLEWAGIYRKLWKQYQKEPTESLKIYLQHLGEDLDDFTGNKIRANRFVIKNGK